VQAPHPLLPPVRTAKPRSASIIGRTGARGMAQKELIQRKYSSDWQQAVASHKLNCDP
jgi:hypothetical protein